MNVNESSLAILPNVIKEAELKRTNPLTGALAREPFRVFFPWATLAGIIGVALWPLNLLGVIAMYPGQFHARIMAHGLFGGFILGFLGTAMPRMLSAQRLRWFEVAPLLIGHVATVAAYATGHIQAGNAIFLSLLVGFFGLMAGRFWRRKDLPPPGFVLVLLSLLSAAGGAALGIFDFAESHPKFLTIERLLTYQGFILFPILGIGPFILPRFYGLNSAHDLPESLTPTTAWLKKALLAASTGIIIIGSFVIEANGAIRIAYALRALAVAAYMFSEMPLKKGPAGSDAFGIGIRISLLATVAGFLTIAIAPAFRVGLLHITFIGGFAVITLVVATRVLFGHSGNLAKLKGRNRWFPLAMGLMLFGMATRVSGDFWPKIMASHYIYGAILWIIGVLIWAIYALPKALVVDEE